MKVNNASLTGESEDILRLPEEKSKNIFESGNVAFFGTSCTNGSGIGIVFKTGDRTVIGQIANLAQSASSGKSPIAIEIDRFVKIIGSIAVSMGLFFFAINFAFGYDIITNIGFMIGLIVANVPEGLYITVTVCMALAAQRMAARSVLVKNLQSVETMGSASCICSDKTGTLTQNRMTVSNLFYNGNVVLADTTYDQFQKDNIKYKIDYNLDDPAFQELLQCMILGSKASFSYNPTTDEIKQFIGKERKIPNNKIASLEVTDEEKQRAKQAMIAAEKERPIIDRKTVGDASETGIIKFSQAIRDIDEYRKEKPVFSFMDGGQQIEALIPFSSEIKFNMFIRDMNP